MDLVQLEGTFVAWYADFLGRHESASLPVPPLVLRAHNVEYTIWQMLATREKKPLKRLFLRTMAGRLEKFERRYLPQFDAVAAITEDDAQRLRALGCPEPVVFVPAGVELSRFRPDPAIQPKPRTLFMIGSLNWLPNLEGAGMAAARGVAHRTRRNARRGAARSRHRHARAPAGPRTDNVFMHGFTESAAAFMQQYELMLVPLLSGGGMRIKIIEGMALGKAILSTRMGAEGIAVRDGEDIFCATARGLAGNLARLVPGRRANSADWGLGPPHRHGPVRQRPRN